MNSEISLQIDEFFSSFKDVLEEIKTHDEILYDKIVDLYDLRKNKTHKDVQEILDGCQNIYIDDKAAVSKMMRSFGKLHKLLPLSQKRGLHHEARIFDIFVCLIDVCSWSKDTNRNT